MIVGRQIVHYNGGRQFTIMEGSLESMRQPPPLLTSLEIPLRITRLFHYKEHIVCENALQFMVYSVSLKKPLGTFVKTDPHSILIPHPPHILALFSGQYIRFYHQGDLSGEAASCLYPEDWTCKISKMEPRCLSRFNQGYYLGGYNRSRLPGQHRTKKRFIFYIQCLRTLRETKKNRMDRSIQLEESEEPVSQMAMQSPYLVAYCFPTAYVIDINRWQIMVKFNAKMESFILLEGRHAMNVLNGIGVGLQGKVFTFDVESVPLYGVEIIEYENRTWGVWSEKTGKVLICWGTSVLQFTPLSGKTLCLVSAEEICAVECTQDNLLMLARRKGDGTIVDVYRIQ